MHPSIGLGASEEKFVVAAGRADLSWWHQLMPSLQGLAQVLQQLLHLLPLGNIKKLLLLLLQKGLRVTSAPDGCPQIDKTAKLTLSFRG